MYLCNYFNYLPDSLRKIKVVDEEVIFAGASLVHTIFTIGAPAWILFHPQGLKPWWLISLMFTKEKEKKSKVILGIYTSLDYLLLLSKRFQVSSLAPAWFLNE